MISAVFVCSFLSLSKFFHSMEAVGFFQDFVFPAFLSLIVYYFILPKLMHHLVGYDSRSDGIVHDKVGFLKQIREDIPEKVHGVSGFRVVSREDDRHEEELINRGKAVGITDSGVVEELFGLLEELKGEKESVVGGGGGVEEKVFDECSEKSILDEIQEEKGSPVADCQSRFNCGYDDDDFGGRKAKSDEGVCGNSESEDYGGETRVNASENSRGDDHQAEEEGLFGDWEGIERTELEKRFDAALAFVESKSNADRIDSNLRMQLYGLGRVAMEGPCHEPQPMALKVSARAKWNAWQKLGNMSADAAMEQYMDLLSKRIPKWEDEERE